MSARGGGRRGAGTFSRVRWCPPPRWFKRAGRVGAGWIGGRGCGYRGVIALCSDCRVLSVRAGGFLVYRRGKTASAGGGVVGVPLGGRRTGNTGGAPLLLVERVQGGIAECSGFIVHSLQSAISAGRRAASVRGDGEEARVEGVQGVGERRAGDGEEVLQGV